MATPPPHLLTLPREVRNLIYPYLHQDICFYWIEEHHNGPMDLPAECQVCLRQAPLLSVLLTHSRLKAEYMESVCFKRFAATIRARPHPPPDTLSMKSWDNRQTAPDLSAWPEVETILTRVQHVDIFFDCSDIAQQDRYPEVENACGLSLIVDIVAKSAPSLSILRIAITHSIRYSSKRSDHSHDHDNAIFSSKAFLPTPPFLRASLPLIQRAKGFHTDDDPNTTVHSWYYQRNGFKNGFHVYSRAPTNESFWTTDDMVHEWKLRLKRQMYGKLPSWCRNGSVSVENTPEPTLPVGFTTWREKRGAEDAVAWFEESDI